MGGIFSSPKSAPTPTIMAAPPAPDPVPVADTGEGSGVDAGGQILRQRRATSGRQSTIMSDSLGAGYA
jgi:hypothetical protein